jgi:segregation and condensation protein B
MSEAEKEVAKADDLGRSYAELLQQDRWDTDGLPGPGEDTAAVAAEADAQPASPPTPLRIIEALLFVGGEPLTATRAGAIIRGLSPEQFSEALDELNRAYRRQGRPYAIVPQGPGYVLTLRPRYRRVVDKLYGGIREARLSAAAIDVLALLAYRQPATKLEIDGIRGADSGALLRQLVRRGLATVLERGDASRKQVSYGTTARFLELFGLRSLDDLPRTQDLQQL